MAKLVLATRRSALALAQARAFVASLKAAVGGVEVEELHVVTTGDRIVDRPLNEIGGKGLFLKEVEQALIDGRADIAVHSLKDVPAELEPGMHLACIPRREDPRDVFIARDGMSLSDLPSGARVGTSSLRRVAQLREQRPDLEFLPLRGNIETRIRKCTEGSVDAIVLAYAGIRRLGLQPDGMTVLEPERCLPAVGQGALAIECRAGDREIQRLLERVHDAESAAGAHAERGLLAAVEGSCKIPVAAYAQRVGEELWLRGFLAELDGSRCRRGERRVAWPSDEQQARRVGLDLGQELRGAVGS